MRVYGIQGVKCCGKVWCTTTLDLSVSCCRILCSVTSVLLARIGFGLVILFICVVGRVLCSLFSFWMFSVVGWLV